MRKPITIMLALSTLLLPAAFAAAQSWGTIDPDVPRLTARDAAAGKAPEGSKARLEGTIGMQCSSGCWFYLQDETGRALVDLEKLGLGLPPSAGRKALVTGVIENRDGVFRLSATGLQVD